MEKRSDPAVRPNHDDIRLSVWIFHDPEVCILSDTAHRALLNLIAAYAGTFVGSSFSDAETPGFSVEDVDILHRLARVTPHAWSRVKVHVLKFFTVRKGRLYLDRDWIEIAKARSSIPLGLQRDLRSDGRVCTYCGTDRGPFDIDHILPVARGGTNDAANLTLACARCNRSKGAKTLREWRA